MRTAILRNARRSVSNVALRQSERRGAAWRSRCSKPDTVVRWHRSGCKAYWRRKSQGAVGRPKISKEIRDLIREVNLANPLWGAPRIHGELLKVGIDVAQSTVAKYMIKGRRPHGVWASAGFTTPAQEEFR